MADVGEQVSRPITVTDPGTAPVTAPSVGDPTAGTGPSGAVASVAVTAVVSPPAAGKLPCTGFATAGALWIALLPGALGVGLSIAGTRRRTIQV